MRARLLVLDAFQEFLNVVNRAYSFVGAFADGEELSVFGHGKSSDAFRAVNAWNILLSAIG